MLGRKNIKGVLAVVVAALFVTAFAYQASAFSSGSSTPFSYTGQIVALDDAGKTLTVQAGPNDERVFNLNDGAAVTLCDTSGSFADLKIGDTVDVRYFADKDHYIANTIDLVMSGMKRC